MQPRSLAHSLADCHSVIVVVIVIVIVIVVSEDSVGWWMMDDSSRGSLCLCFVLGQEDGGSGRAGNSHIANLSDQRAIFESSESGCDGQCRQSRNRKNELSFLAFHGSQLRGNCDPDDPTRSPDRHLLIRLGS